jgi:hypothetical protein
MHFTKVSRTLWRSKKFRAVSNDARLLYLYLLTCPHNNAAGCFVLPPEYGRADIEFSVSQWEDSLSALSEAGLVLSDRTEEVILITNWFTFNAPLNGKHAAGIRKVIASVPSPRLKALCAAAFEACDGYGSHTISDIVSEPSRYKEKEKEKKTLSAGENEGGPNTLPIEGSHSGREGVHSLTHERARRGR